MSYKISNYTFKKLDELNDHYNQNFKIKPSTKSNYKIDIFLNNKYIFSVGDKRYSDFSMYLKSAGKAHAFKRRELYYKRHPVYPRLSKGWFGAYLLW